MIAGVMQVCIVVLSLLATWLSLHPTRQRYACVFGVAVQPFWLVVTYQNRQWGMFALCFVYGAIWLKSAWQHWVQQ